MKFAEMPYQRVDTEAVVAALKELTQELKAAKSGEEQFEIHQKFYALRDEYNTTIQIAMIRSDVDTADEFYSEEKNYYNEVLPTINNQETEYRKALYYSPYREVLEEKIGKVAFKSMELEFKAMDEKLIPLMIANALNDKPLPVYGKGENVRDWLYVEDHCKAIDLIIHKGRVGEVYNIGGHNEMKNIDIVKIICKELGKPESLITYVTDRKGHDMRYAIDPTKIHNELGWLPETKFADGIKKTIKWYLDNKEWWETIISGEYQNYYEKMYGNR